MLIGTAGRMNVGISKVASRWVRIATRKATAGGANAEVAARLALEHVLPQCSAVNDSDASALESLEAVVSRLKDSDIALHFSEIKGPVMDKLNRTHFLQRLNGQVFLTGCHAIAALTPEVIG